MSVRRRIRFMTSRQSPNAVSRRSRAARCRGKLRFSVAIKGRRCSGKSEVKTLLRKRLCCPDPHRPLLMLLTRQRHQSFCRSNRNVPSPWDSNLLWETCMEPDLRVPAAQCDPDRRDQYKPRSRRIPLSGPQDRPLGTLVYLLFTEDLTRSDKRGNRILVSRSLHDHAYLTLLLLSQHEMPLRFLSIPPSSVTSRNHN